MQTERARACVAKNIDRLSVEAFAERVGGCSHRPACPWSSSKYETKSLWLRLGASRKF